MFLVIPRTAIEANIEAALESCLRAAAALPSEPGNQYRVYPLPSISVATRLVSSSPVSAINDPVLIVPVPPAILFTADDLFSTPERLKNTLRGTLRAARDIWSNVRRPGIDFDRDGIFYRHPFSPNDDLATQTAVLFNLPQTIGKTVKTGKAEEPLPDLLLSALGRRDEGLPLLEDFRQSCGVELSQLLTPIAPIGDLLGDPRALSSLEPLAQPADSATPIVLSLQSAHGPAWLSYSQWMRRLRDTPQGRFIKEKIVQPQRVDGPAGTGKTLSLVLKCLTTLIEAQARGDEHHAAFVVFSEETRAKVLESFLEPLDERRFHELDRSRGDRQTLTITTLLSWSRNELKSVVGPFELSAQSASQVRQDQYEIVKDVLSAHLRPILSAAGMALSSQMRNLCADGAERPVVVRMFMQEFGIVIKGMADGGLRRYLTIERPAIGLPCTNQADRRLVFALFERYEAQLRTYGIVDLDDVAVSHIKLLQMPLRREVREKLAFDSVFVDEAHSFNPNELAIFFLLTRRSELPPLVIAVDLPQALGDKGYEGSGLDEAMFREFEDREKISVQRFDLEDIHRCPQAVLDVASSIYAQGHGFFAPIKMPGALNSATKGFSQGTRPLAKGYLTSSDLLGDILIVAESLTQRLGCSRSDILVAIMQEELLAAIPQSMLNRSEILTKRTDVEATQKARRANHFMIARPEHLHGLEFEGVVLVGVSRGELPRLDHGPLGSGAAAVFETQRAVDLLYLTLTRARREVVLLYVGEPSTLLTTAIAAGLVNIIGKTS